MPDYKDIFTNQAPKYDVFVSAEDYQGNLIAAIKDLCGPMTGHTVADLGSGTGRMSFLLAPLVGQVYGIEPSAGMRQTAESKRVRLGIRNMEFLEGEHKAVPLPDECIDLVVEGWAFLAAFMTTYPDWRKELEAIFAEVRRILKPNGKVVLIETMGTFHMWDRVPADPPPNGLQIPDPG
jgi:ubiquinone/menaquinone biosynthesis C-methylase UbiE